MKKEKISRGEYLSKVLGLDYTKKNITTVSKVKTVKKEKTEYEKYQAKKFSYTVDDFDIDDTTYAITCKKWGKGYIKGGNSYFGSMEIIQRYVDECHKPFDKRDFSWMHAS